jgi:CDP-diacylglycerol--glycerol-3-phosphate 3-phosphatidyltransferase
MDRPRRLKFVTAVTFLRFPLILIFFTIALLNTGLQKLWLFYVAFASLVISEITDLIDGYLARKLKAVTRFGAHADPLMDKFVYLTTLPLLVFITTTNGHKLHGIFLLILTISVLMRDQWVTFLRSVGSMYNVEAGANWAGKLRTCINFPLICAIYFSEGLPGGIHFGPVLYIMEAVALVINILSVYVYTRRYWKYLSSLVKDESSENL